MKTSFPKSSGTPQVSWMVFAATFWLATCGCAVAAEVGGSLVATTDYVFRGVSQTNHGAAAQGDVHLKTSNGWFGGAWGSIAISRPDLASDSEFNLYLGRAWALAPEWTGSVHYARYLFPDNRPYVQYFYDDYDELQAAVNFQTRLTISVALAPDILRYSFSDGAVRRGNQWSYEGSFRQPLWRNLSLTAGAGYYDLSDLFRKSYWAWSGGVELPVRELQFNLTRFGADASARRMFGRQTADGRWALTATWRF